MRSSRPASASVLAYSRLLLARASAPTMRMGGMQSGWVRLIRWNPGEKRCTMLPVGSPTRPQAYSTGTVPPSGVSST